MFWRDASWQPKVTDWTQDLNPHGRGVAYMEKLQEKLKIRGFMCGKRMPTTLYCGGEDNIASIISPMNSCHEGVELTMHHWRNQKSTMIQRCKTTVGNMKKSQDKLWERKSNGQGVLPSKFYVC